MERDEDRTGVGGGSSGSGEHRGPDAVAGRDSGPASPGRDWADEIQSGPTRQAKATLLIVVSLAMLAGLVLCCFAIADVFEALGPFF